MRQLEMMTSNGQSDYEGYSGKHTTARNTTTTFTRETPTNSSSEHQSRMGFQSTPLSEEKRVLTPSQYPRVLAVCEEDVPTPDVGQKHSVTTNKAHDQPTQKIAASTEESHIPPILSGGSRQATPCEKAPSTHRSKISSILRPILILARENNGESKRVSPLPDSQVSAVSEDGEDNYETPPPRVSLHLNRFSSLVPSDLMKHDDDSKSIASSVAQSTHSKIKRDSTPGSAEDPYRRGSRSTLQRVTPKSRKLESPLFDDKIQRRGSSLTHRSGRTGSTISSSVRKPVLDKPLPDMPAVPLPLSSDSNSLHLMSANKMGQSAYMKPSPPLRITQQSTEQSTIAALGNIRNSLKLDGQSSQNSSADGVVAVLEKEYQVIHPYKPDLSDELALRRGDRVMIYQVFDDGWCYGRITNQFRQKMNVMVEGICPAACLAPL